MEVSLFTFRVTHLNNGILTQRLELESQQRQFKRMTLSEHVERMGDKTNART